MNVGLSLIVARAVLGQLCRTVSVRYRIARQKTLDAGDVGNETHRAYPT